MQEPEHHHGLTTELPKGLSVHAAQDAFYHIRKPEKVHWSIAWSDLMMTMFILFLVLYVYHSAKRDFIYGQGEALAPAPEITETVPEIIDQQDTKIQQKDKTPDTSMTASYTTVSEVDLVEDQTVRIILPADLLFDIGRADLKSEAVNSLIDVAEVIKKTPYMVNVVGHTDNLPMHSEKFTTNWELSATRACVVARFLIEEMKIPTYRFYITGHSYNQPLKANNSVKNRAENRRVEIIITKEKPKIHHSWRTEYDKDNL
jgi:chemotaxis protein MotB